MERQPPGQEFRLDTLNVRMLPDGHLAAKAYGRPVEGGRGAYVSFTVPDRPELAALIARPPTGRRDVGGHRGRGDGCGRPHDTGLGCRAAATSARARRAASGSGSACTMVSSDTARVSTT